MLLQGIAIPLMFLANLRYTLTTGHISWFWCYVYHVIRIGPYFTNFAYAYTLCHKEGHTKIGMFSNRFRFLNNVFNWWIALFYGVLPSTFFYGAASIQPVHLRQAIRTIIIAITTASMTWFRLGMCLATISWAT